MQRPNNAGHAALNRRSLNGTKKNIGVLSSQYNLHKNNLHETCLAYLAFPGLGCAVAITFFNLLTWLLIGRVILSTASAGAAGNFRDGHIYIK